MSQAAIPIGRTFQSWARPLVSNSNNRFLLLTASPDIEHELWSVLEYYSEVEEVGLNLIQAKGLQPQSLHLKIFKSFQAFVRQAKSYYGSAKTLHYRSSSLLYYYSFLNLVKAYLLFRDPQRIMGRTAQSETHGLSYRSSTTNIDFQREAIRVHDGIFPLFYEAQTSNVIARNSTLNILSLLSYPTEISYQYILAGYGDPHILSSLAVAAVDLTNNQVWTILGFPAEASLNSFLSLHTNFLNTYQEVQIDHNLLAIVFGMSVPDLYSFRFFQVIATTQTLGNGFIDQADFRQKIINVLSTCYSTHYFDDNKDFDLVLPYTDSTYTTPLPITEALVIYAVMFYLSSLVRYRPDYLEELLNTKPAWLIENFVTSTPETFLRIMVCKIIERDVVFRRR